MDALNKISNKKLLALYREISNADFDYLPSTPMQSLFEASEYFNMTAKMEDVDNSIKAEIINRFNAGQIK